MRIVVKVGTSTLAHPGGLLNIRHTEDLVKVWSDIQNAGHQLIVVSSAATGLGVGKLQIEKPSDITTKQAAAAVGQCELMYTYDRLFGQYNHTVAQMLLTWEDFDHENRLHNLQNTLERLLQLHAIPIINENDPVACEEYSLGDNDTLAALVAKCIHADLVVLMSDIDGLYTADPHTHPDAKLIPVVEEITPEVIEMAGGAGSSLGTGGMATKLQAAQVAMSAGVNMVIASGSEEGALRRILQGEEVGTVFAARESHLRVRKSWLAFGKRLQGDLVVDAGCVKALEGGSSLLAAGIKAVDGDFEVGSTVRVLAEDNREIARGIVNYNTEDLRRLIGHRTEDFEQLVAGAVHEEVIHRDNMVLMV